jgi:uncharacterized protein YjbJ (UPF0337 family)
MAKMKVKNRTRRRSSKSNALFFVCAVLGIIVAALPTVILICVGMIPTAVAYIIDLTPGRYATRCVAGLNVAGVVPFLEKLWTSGNDMYSAIAIVTDVFAWLSFYVSSGMGWMLFLGLPSLVASFKTCNAKRKANHLRERLEELKEEWGEDVTGNPLDAAEGLQAEIEAAAAAGAEKQPSPA